jgi:hypothetical protein
MAFCWLNSKREVQWPRNLFFLLGLRSSYLGKHMVFWNVVVQATLSNCAEINGIFALILSNVQDLRDRLASDRSKHLIAKTSSLGWKFVSSLDLLEGKVGHLSMLQLCNQEKAYMAHEVAMASLGKSSGVAPDGGCGGGGRGGSKGNKG